MILDNIIEKIPAFFCLLDPDKQDVGKSVNLAKMYENNGADAIMVGGSLMLKNRFSETIKKIKQEVKIPVLIFPGVYNFIAKEADALLNLSLISSRNPQFLIGEHVRTAGLIKKYNLVSIPVGYILVESGKMTSVQYMSNSIPIPRDKNDIAVAHALAAQYLGMKMIYLEAGSGAVFPVSDAMISEVKKNIDIPLIVGGGIRNPEVAAQKI
ncbi:MAG: geranylgeranylglyceryl/heptaprenylglyceryl phosphate synthase, partial [Candidatus Cloacimonadota bacterium]|nr:geranylgeranylglyceryl/heptaprenylglyceryl phosphate synthase [Candidatus Cloacimonadota bacterium]